MSMSPKLLRPRQTGFDPRSISGLIVWLDATDGSYNATTGTWTDKSGNNRNFTQGDVNNRPIISATLQNGKTVVEFDGLNDQLTSPTNFLQIPSCTLFAAFRRAGNTFGGIISSSGGSDRSPGILIDSAVGIVRGYQNFSSAGAAVVDSFCVASGQVDLGSTTLFINGTQRDADATVSTLDTSQTTTAIGTYRQAASNFFSGVIGDIIAYNRVLTATERRSIERYLGNKFGVTVV